MAYTGNNSVQYAQSFIGNLNPTVFYTSEPALTTLNTITALIVNAPFQWSWNRALVTQVLTAGTQDYTINVANFGYLEKASVNIASGSPAGEFEILDVRNNTPLSLTTVQNRPAAVAVQTQVVGTSIFVRFSPTPDQAYTVSLVYQKAPFFWTATTQDWFTNAGIPLTMMDVFNPLFLAEAFEFANDEERASKYRTRGMAALLAKQEGLSSMQKNEILGQWNANNLQLLVAQQKTQQATQARAV
jgi:hypothetical protein